MPTNLLRIPGKNIWPNRRNGSRPIRRKNRFPAAKQPGNGTVIPANEPKAAPGIERHRPAAYCPPSKINGGFPLRWRVRPAAERRAQDLSRFVSAPPRKESAGGNGGRK
ncbi:hypothetical protein B4135_2334 [Caldibacillus debilis]|uniref:Uncharacterized protein n=1 Tax=Caldibacillus debilis TaxID=301148 RepID=A0A150M298_9BACI|nr:hypothetical protein B4135_2334 [Caldibacillus debilis]